MRRADLGGQLGDKIGPRLVDLAVQATLSARRGLAPHEALIARTAAKGLIDEAGREIADLYEPLLRDVITRETTHPLLKEHLAKAASGRHQWQAIAGFAFGASGASGAIGQVLSNEVAPLVYGVIRDNPHLLPDVGTLAQLEARGLISEGSLVSAGGANGYTAGWSRAIADAAAAVPDFTTLIAMLNRGIIDWDTALYWLGRAAVPAQLQGEILGLRRTVLSPADAALAVLRGSMTLENGQQIAGWSGMWPGDFDTLISNTGEPLGLEQLLEAYRRGYIDQPRLERGIRQSRVRDEWIGVAEQLRYSPVPTADAIDAYQRGRIAKDLAYQIAEQNGTAPDQVDILAANAGNPPSPEQLLELWRRGAITEATVKTGLLEGRTKDEWITIMLGLVDEPMSTADAADAWLRGHLTQPQAEAIMKENGVMARDIPVLLANAGNPLALGELLEAYRRKFITAAQLETGVRESRYRDEWLPTLLKLATSRMSTADAITASVQSYLTQDQAQEIAEENGLAPADFLPLWETAGEPLSRTELTQLYNRGLITQDVFVQGLKESRLKDKYIDAAVQLHTRLLPAREVVAALEQGAIDEKHAWVRLTDEGYDEHTVHLLIKTGMLRATGPYRQLAAGEITTLYADRIIDAAKATAMLTQLHYGADLIPMMLTLADYRRDQKVRDAAITAIRAHYLAYRTETADAKADLLALRLPSDAADFYIQTWQIERLAHPKQLSEAQIVKAAKTGLFVPRGSMSQSDWNAANQKTGCERLVKLGYSEQDAKLLLAGA
jgi:hypothetical protein